MKTHLKITFNKTEMESFGNYRLGRSVGIHEVFEVSYNTENKKRAFTFAKRKIKALKKQDNALYGLNYSIQVV